MTQPDSYQQRHFPVQVGTEDTNPKLLPRLRFSGLNVSHMGALASCLEYLELPCSREWLFGATGQAFLLTVDSHVLNRTPNFAPANERIQRLAGNIGLAIEGISREATGDEYRRLAEEAGARLREAVDQGLPCYGRGLDEPSEYSVVIGYSAEGFYTHGWHQRGGAPIPWDRMGLPWCPCDGCTEFRAKRGFDKPADAGTVDLHWVSRSDPQDDHTTVREALSFVLSQASGTDSAGNAVGLSAYDTWISGMSEGTVEGFHVGYTCDLYKESRFHAVGFLKEAKGRLGDTFTAELNAALGHYERVYEEATRISNLFPWMQPRAPIHDVEKRMAGVAILRAARAAEERGLEALQSLLTKLS